MASIDYIECIGPKNATRLRKARIRTTEALLKRGATRAGRREVAEATGLTERQVLEWVNRADLMRVKGVGSEYSDLLEASGVDTVKELRRRNAQALTAKLVEINNSKHHVRRLPTEAMVLGWIKRAKELEPLVQH